MEQTNNYCRVCCMPHPYTATMYSHIRVTSHLGLQLGLQFIFVKALALRKIVYFQERRTARSYATQKDRR